MSEHIRKVKWGVGVLCVLGVACLCAGFLLVPSASDNGASEDALVSINIGQTFSASDIKAIGIKDIHVNYDGNASLVVIVSVEDGEIHIWFDEMEPLSVEEEPSPQAAEA